MDMLTTLAILGIRTRYLAVIAVAAVVVIVAAGVRASRSRRPSFELRPMTSEDSQRYIDEFASIEREFIDRPEQAAARARGMVEEVMRRRGFPDRIEPAQRIRDLGGHDREGARALESANTDLRAAGNDTERLRRAVQEYRRVLYRLTGNAEISA